MNTNNFVQSKSNLDFEKYRYKGGKEKGMSAG